ncbi:hypothetical protein [Flectobacillus longus]|uniref:hypothetical protein n=1 Tax=Flectobacillus longus TaxID=2984207 RepID=UPI0024B6D3CA|nr:hypothetical protein [Flectobacillus longus]MDI9880051.1 hypothetical protein [Flectobacillus longus]
MRQLTGLILLLLLSYTSFSQYRPPFKQYTSIEFGGGVSSYYGDLAPMSQFVNSTANSLRWTATIGLSRQMTRQIEIGLNLSWIVLGADDYYSNNLSDFLRNLHFRNNVKEATLQGRWTPFNKASSPQKRATFEPYIGIGVGAFLHNPQAKLPVSMGNEWVDLKPLITEGQGSPNYPDIKEYKSWGINVPISLGLKTKLTKNLDLIAELNYRMLFFDYIDDVSGVYAQPIVVYNQFTEPTRSIGIAMSQRTTEGIAAATGKDRLAKLNTFVNDPTGIAISQNQSINSPRGTVDGNDSYATFTLKLRYIFIPGIQCPKLY